MAITWREISAPDFRGAQQGVAAAGEAFDRAIQGLTNIGSAQQDAITTAYDNNEAAKLAQAELALKGLSDVELVDLSRDPTSIVSLLGSDDPRTQATFGDYLSTRANAIISAATAANKATQDRADKFALAAIKGDQALELERLKQAGKAPKQTTYTFGTAVETDKGVLTPRRSSTGVQEYIDPQGNVVVDFNLKAKPTGKPTQEEAFKSQGRTMFSTGLDVQGILDKIDESDIANAGGVSSIGGALLPSSRDSVAKINQLLSSTFLQNVSALKGMGALSNAEGSKVTGAASALVDPETNQLKTGLTEDFLRSELAKAYEGSQNMQLIGNFYERNGREPTIQELSAMRIQNKVAANPFRTTDKVNTTPTTTYSNLWN